MPIYEYECSKCGKTIEVIQTYSDKPLKKHEACGGTLTKLISASGFQFKGTGWYVTDYARKSSNQGTEDAKDSKTDSQEKTPSNGSKESSTDTASTNTGKSDKTSKPSKSRTPKD